MNESLKTLIGAPRLPVVVAPMFIVSTPKMVIESCRAGVLSEMFPIGEIADLLDRGYRQV